MIRKIQAVVQLEAERDSKIRELLGANGKTFATDWERHQWSTSSDEPLAKEVKAIDDIYYEKIRGAKQEAKQGQALKLARKLSKTFDYEVAKQAAEFAFGQRIISHEEGIAYRYTLAQREEMATKEAKRLEHDLLHGIAGEPGFNFHWVVKEIDPERYPKAAKRAAMGVIIEPPHESLTQCTLCKARTKEGSL